MAIIGIQLTWVVVKDLNEAIKFYTEILGFSLKEAVPQYGWAELQGTNGARVGLAAEQPEKNEWDPIHVKAGSNGVITITVDNIEETTADYRRKGVKLLGNIMEVPNEVKLQTFQDADGNLFQLAEILRQPE